MPSQDFQPNALLVVHELPSAPKFIGREEELRVLREFWSGDKCVLSLIGLGGAGKTALADQHLRWVLDEDPPEKTMVWSFYDDPDTNAFLEALYRFLSGDIQAEVKGSGWFHLLREQLSGARRILIVMDGLERVQRPITDASGIYGEIEDPLLRGLLVRLATGKGRSKAVITSRFPVATIEPYLHKGYQIVNVEQLPLSSASQLLASRGIELDESQAKAFFDTFGSHALTMDLLAGAIFSFFGGRPENLPAEKPPKDASERLAFVLGLYERHLQELDRDLLSRLCVFRFGVDFNTLERIFSKSENPHIAGSLAQVSTPQLLASIDRLVEHHLVYRESNDRFTVHPAVRDHFYRLFRDPSEVHEAIAGHLSTLTDRPGIGLPVDKDSLDLLEELVYHAIRANAVDKAIEIYFGRLGGNDHLNGKLGEYARCFRILSAFPECPDPSGMYHCERAFGNLEKALEWRSQNRYILLIAGRLTELSEDPGEGTRSFARALQGAPDASIPDRSPDFPIPSAMAYLLRGDVDAAKRVAETEIAISIYEDDKIRNTLALAEAFRQEGRLGQAKDLVERASAWILQSASQEHLVSLHYVRAQIAIDENQPETATFAIEEGLTIAQESQLLLYEVLLRLAKCRLGLPDQMDEARALKAICDTPAFRFAYGSREAARYLASVRA